MTTIAMTASMRDATAKPATTPWPKSASRRVTMPVDNGATRFDAVAGKPTCRICRAECSQPSTRGTSMRSFTASQYMHSAKLISRAITNDHAAPSMPSAGSPAQPKIRNGPIRYLQQRTDRHHDARHRRIAG